MTFVLIPQEFSWSRESIFRYSFAIRPFSIPISSSNTSYFPLKINFTHRVNLKWVVEIRSNSSLLLSHKEAQWLKSNITSYDLPKSREVSFAGNAAIPQIISRYHSWSNSNLLHVDISSKYNCHDCQVKTYHVDIKALPQEIAKKLYPVNLMRDLT